MIRLFTLCIILIISSFAVVFSQSTNDSIKNIGTKKTGKVVSEGDVVKKAGEGKTVINTDYNKKIAAHVTDEMIFSWFVSGDSNLIILKQSDSNRYNSISAKYLEIVSKEPVPGQKATGETAPAQAATVSGAETDTTKMAPAMRNYLSEQEKQKQKAGPTEKTKPGKTVVTVAGSEQSDASGAHISGEGEPFIIYEHCYTGFPPAIATKPPNYRIAIHAPDPDDPDFAVRKQEWMEDYPDEYQNSMKPGNTDAGSEGQGQQEKPPLLDPGPFSPAGPGK